MHEPGSREEQRAPVHGYPVESLARVPARVKNNSLALSLDLNVRLLPMNVFVICHLLVVFW